jgi:hypothetical protein
MWEPQTLATLRASTACTGIKQTNKYFKEENRSGFKILPNNSSHLIPFCTTQSLLTLSLAFQLFYLGQDERSFRSFIVHCHGPRYRRRRCVLSHNRHKTQPRRHLVLKQKPAAGASLRAFVSLCFQILWTRKDNTVLVEQQFDRYWSESFMSDIQQVY